MPFTPSIGDVVMMAQIAWKLAQAFTKGRKSAPAEFCEVENQLYSLSATLEAIKRAQEKVIHQPTSSPHRIGCWSQYVVKNWRKIEWTTEKGDLSALRNQIIIHTNSLNLLLGVATSSQAARIRKTVETSSAMIKELYEWYGDNIKGFNTTGNDKLAQSPSPPAYASTSTLATAPLYTFELSIRTSREKETICPRAHFNRDGDQTSYFNSSSSEAEPMLACACQNAGGAELHKSVVQRYKLSHITFPARLADDKRSWILFKTTDKATNQLVSLYITAIHPSYMRTLEEAILQDLAIRRADAILEKGIGNSLCYLSVDTGEERLLASIGELRTAHESIESITFNHGGRTYRRNYVENIQILQYQTLSLDSLTKGCQSEPLRPLDYAEVLITYGQDDEARSDVVSSTLHLKRNTELKLDDGHALVQIESVETMGTFMDERTACLGDVGITIQLTSRQAARELHGKLEDMRMELFIRGLRYPRSDESVALRLQFANIECEYMCVPDADVTVTVDTQRRHRLIIESRNKCTIMSQVLVDDFFNSVSGKPNYTQPTYVVQYDEKGTRNVYKYERGFRCLNLGGQQGISTSVSFVFAHSLRALYLGMVIAVIHLPKAEGDSADRQKIL
ncbi:uncharacterized protein F4807DRAFT_454253 [Annulohypoxylon truncatum]|uniref:uncharacterized protein n=1 Tax=Annulohypoxylon truncatum TaxID=327061 RepID=UPI0020077571|nr:uncharacterized protein F4807DRAFT_454253 [Annulohypoxylon truncatum]KAI1204995.1 hypothetical protein F4807DRAFT_454253 [Annulohypoxylon truncatum]